MPKDASRQPTKLERLAEVIATLQDDEGEGYIAIEAVLPDAQRWLTWTYNFLSARKLYHKKARIKDAMLRKMAETLLSPDELASVDQEAENQLGGLEDEQIETVRDPAYNREEIR